MTILSLATATPPNAIDQEAALAVAQDIIDPRFDGFDRMASIFTNAGVQHRQLAMPVDWYRTPHDFVERSRIYLDVALDLFVAAAEKALAEAGVSANEIDTIVTVSTTGIATPSLEARAMTRLGFRTDVARIPVFGLGCAGGATGLGLASKLARAAPDQTILFVTVELCTLAQRMPAVDKADIISVALFGDGAAACVLRSGDEGFAEVTGTAETIWPDTLDIMGWQMEPDGLGVVLNRAIPSFAARHMRKAMEDMLERQALRLGDVDRFVFHPGGAKVIEAVESALSLNQGALDHEREVLRLHGNMSAPTALFVLDRVRAAGMPPRSVVAALGPGFTASTVMLKAAA